MLASLGFPSIVAIAIVGFGWFVPVGRRGRVENLGDGAQETGDDLEGDLHVVRFLGGLGWVGLVL